MVFLNALYHITAHKNTSSILESGLHPLIGERAKKQGETEPAVYLFRSLNDIETAMLNWLGEAFCEDEVLDVLEVNLPLAYAADLVVDKGGFEFACKQIIPGKYVRNLGDVNSLF